MVQGGFAPLGYVPHERTLVVDEPQAERVREIFRLYLQLGSVYALKAELDRLGWVTPVREGRRIGGGVRFTRGHLYRLLSNAIYIGQIVHKGVAHSGLHPGIIDADVWNAAQALLAENLRSHRNQSTAREPSLLTGLVFDDQGRRLQPSHATKGAKRYRYYFRPADDATSLRALRVPAPELETAVVSGLVTFLRDEHRVMGLLGQTTADAARVRLRAANDLAANLESAVASARIELLKQLLARVTIGAGSLEVVLRNDAVSNGEVCTSDPESTTSIVLPVTIKRCGLGVRLIVRGAEDSRERVPDQRLIALLAKAQRWFAMLRTEQYPSVLAIAQEQGLATSDVTRTIYLAFLAPDIVQSIVLGQQPVGLGAKRLLAMAPLPLDWGAQRKVLGFEQ